MLSQGDGVRGICAFGICINDNNVASVFDGRAVTEKMFRFHRFADPIHRVLVNDAETRAIIGKQAGQRASGCKLDPRDYDRLFAAVKGK